MAIIGARELCLTGSADQALSAFESVLDQIQEYAPGTTSLELAECHLMLGDLSAAEATFAALAQQGPARSRIHRASASGRLSHCETGVAIRAARAHTRFDRPDIAIDCWAALSGSMHSFHAVVGAIDLIRQVEDRTTAYAICDDMLKRNPSEFVDRLADRMTTARMPLLFLEWLATRVQPVTSSGADTSSVDLVLSRLDSMSRTGTPKARDRRPRSDSPSLVDVELALASRDLEGGVSAAETILDSLDPEAPESVRTVAALVPFPDPNVGDKATNTLRQMGDRVVWRQWDPRHRTLLVQALAEWEQPDLIGPITRANPSANPLLVHRWGHAERANFSPEVDRSATRWTRDHPFTLKRLSARSPDSLAADALPLFAKCRDEAHRIGAFLEHYRSLGVTDFLMIDNGSTDGTVERLQGEPDVYLWQNRQPLNRLRDATPWINMLIDELATDHWCLSVDIDEHLYVGDTPIGQAASLRDLVAEFDVDGTDLLSAPMVDMYPNHAAKLSVVDGDLGDFVWFDDTYSRRGLAHAPFANQVGGFRWRLTPTLIQNWMCKTPLFRSTNGRRLELANHTTSHGRPAGIDAVLLHFKFAIADSDRVYDEGNAPLNAMHRNDMPSTSLVCPHSARFKSAKDFCLGTHAPGTSVVDYMRATPDLAGR